MGDEKWGNEGLAVERPYAKMRVGPWSSRSVAEVVVSHRLLCRGLVGLMLGLVLAVANLPVAGAAGTTEPPVATETTPSLEPTEPSSPASEAQSPETSSSPSAAPSAEPSSGVASPTSTEPAPNESAEPSPTPETQILEDEVAAVEPVETLQRLQAQAAITPFAAGASCNYATAGTGAYASTLCWLDFTDFTTGYTVGAVTAEASNSTEFNNAATCPTLGRVSDGGTRYYRITREYRSSLGAEYGTATFIGCGRASTAAAAQANAVSGVRLTRNAGIFNAGPATSDTGPFYGPITNYPVSFDISNTYSFSATLSISSPGGSAARANAIDAVAFPTWSGAFLGNNGFYTGVGGMPALYQSRDPSGDNASDQRTTTAVLGEIQVTNKVTGTRTAGYSIVVADAESTDNGESIAWTQSGALGDGFLWLPNNPSAWSNASTDTARKTAGVGNACPGTDASQFPQNSDLTARADRTCRGASQVEPNGKTGTAMLQASPASATGAFSVTQTMIGSGLQGVAFGLITAGAQLNVTVADRVLTTTGAPGAESFTGTMVGVTAAGGAHVGSWTATTGATEKSASTEAQHMPLIAGSTTNLTFTSSAAGAADTSYRAGWRCTKTTSESNTPTYWPSQTASSTHPPSATATDLTESLFAQLGAGQFIACTVTYTPPYLTLVKTVINTGTSATNSASQWTLTAEQAGSSKITGVGGTQAVTRRPVALGSYNLTEAGPTGSPAPWAYDYAWTDLVCSTDPANPALPPGALTKTFDAQNAAKITASTLTITAAADTYAVQPNVTCTYTNRANLPPATISIGKQVQNVQGADPQPAAGWTVGATLESSTPTGASIMPVASQVTGANGLAPNPWTVIFPMAASPTANVRVQEEAQAGYTFASGTCVITHLTGDPTTTPLSSANQVLTGLLPGDSAACTFVNRPQPGSVTLTKVDPASQPLAGAHFQLWNDVNSNGTLEPATDILVGAEVITPANGVASWSTLAWGRFLVQEVSPPPGYRLGTTTVWPVEIGPTSPAKIAWDLGPIENTPMASPALPLTGGVSSDLYTLLGLSVIGLAVAGFVLLRKRSRRAATE